MAGMRPAGLELRVDGLNAHDPHQALDAFTIHFVALPAQVISHRATSP